MVKSKGHTIQWSKVKDTQCNLLAEQIKANFPDTLAVEKIEIAGPGFINFFMSQGANALVVSL